MTTTLAERFFDMDLWLVGIGHFVVLLASFQVPKQLAWKQDLKQLMPFNRKFIWVQSGFTVLTIVAFGVLTLALHRELMRGDKAALGLAAFAGVYWTARILVDAFYFSHADWPKAFCRGARSVDHPVLLSGREFSWPVHLDRVVERLEGTI
jgi:hypothetical protein